MTHNQSVVLMNIMHAVMDQHHLWLKAAAWLALLSVTTQRTYLSVIREYCAFLGAPAGTAAAADLILATTTMHAQAYVVHLKRQRGEVPRALRINPKRATSRLISATQSPATIAKKIMALRKLYEVLIAHEVYPRANPFGPHSMKVPDPKGGRKRETEMLNFEDVPLVLEAIEDSPRATRDRAILAVLFGGGLRRSEVAKLLLDDVGITPAGTTYLKLRSTKDGRDHMQALPDWAAAAVKELRHEREAQGACPADYLFCRWTGRGGMIATHEPLGEQSVYNVFKNACAQAGLGPQYTPHSARATAITKLLADGTPHREVQEFSRHKSVQMVEWYDKRRFGVDVNPAKGLSFTKRS